MNRKRTSIALTLMLLSVTIFGSRSSFAASGLPLGWYKSGSHPENYEMMIDTGEKHSGKASAHIKFIGEKAEGFGTLMQSFRADDYRGKRLRMSAWMKTEAADVAQLFMRLDGERRSLGFSNMDSHPVKGTTEWKRYDITLDVPMETINIAFGVFMVGRGQVWVDDYQFETVGADVATTDMMTPEMRKQERPYKTSATGIPMRPANLNFEEGAYPERKVAKVDPAIYDAYTGQYQVPDGPVVTLTREGNKLMQEMPDGAKNEWLPLSATEFFSSSNPQGSITFVKNEQGQVTHYVRRRNGQDVVIKKIK